VVDVLPPAPPQHVNVDDAEQWQSVEGASELVTSTCDDSARIETAEVAAFESYGTVETVSNAETDGGVPDVLYVISDLKREPGDNLVSLETSCYETTTTTVPTSVDAGVASRCKVEVLSQSCSGALSSIKDDSKVAEMLYGLKRVVPVTRALPQRPGVEPSPVVASRSDKEITAVQRWPTPRPTKTATVRAAVRS